MPQPLEQELKRYNAELPRLLVESEGKFVLIADDAVVGVYETYADAMNVGYQTKKLEPFLVMQIKPLGSFHYLSWRVVPNALAHR